MAIGVFELDSAGNPARRLPDAEVDAFDIVKTTLYHAWHSKGEHPNLCSPCQRERWREEYFVLISVAQLYLQCLKDDPEREYLTPSEALAVTDIRNVLERLQVHDPLNEDG